MELEAGTPRRNGRHEVTMNLHCKLDLGDGSHVAGTLCPDERHECHVAPDEAGEIPEAVHQQFDSNVVRSGFGERLASWLVQYDQPEEDELGHYAQPQPLAMEDQCVQVRNRYGTGAARRHEREPYRIHCATQCVYDKPQRGEAEEHGREEQQPRAERRGGEKAVAVRARHE